MQNNFELTDESEEGSLLAELECDMGRLRTWRAKGEKQSKFYLGRIIELFGNKPNNRNEQERQIYPDGKYQSWYKIRHKVTGEVFTLYTNYRWWRVGGRGRVALGELLELLNPDVYTGHTGKQYSEQEIHEMQFSSLKHAA